MLEKIERASILWDQKLARRSRGYWLLGLALLVAVFLRVIVAREAVFPGHSDYAFYFAVAENLVDDRSLEVNYIWHYLSNDPRLPSPGNDYWQPGAALIIAPFLELFGKTLPVALIPSILTSLLLAVPVYLWALDYGGSNWAAGCAAVLVWFIPRLFDYAVVTDSTIYYVFFLAWAFWLIGRGRRNPWYFAGAAACVALAHVVRQDSVLTLGILLLAVLFSPYRWKIRVQWVAMALVVYLLVLSPMLAVNLATLGEPLPSAPQRTAYLTSYEDLYSSHRELTPRSYLRWGWENIYRSKVQTAKLIGQQVRDFWPIWMWCLLLGAALFFWFVPYRRPDAYLAVWPMASMLAVMTFYTLVATFPGKFAVYRSGMLVLPYSLVIAVDFLHRLLQRKWMLLVAALVMAVVFGGSALERGYTMVRANNSVGLRLRALDLIVSGDALQRGIDEPEIVIMTRNPWEVYLSTRYAAIMLPNETVDRVYEVAQRYGANYLIASRTRPDIAQNLAENSAGDPRFTRLGPLPYNNHSALFRINYEP